MNDKKLVNQNNNFHEANVLKDYEIEVVKKISFWASLFYKLKKQNTKFLPAVSNTPRKTYKSISYMWNLGNFKASLFNILDNLKNSISKSETTINNNSINLQIIGKGNNHDEISKTTQNNISVIIPKQINKINNK